MSLDVNPSFIPIRTRKLIVQDFRKGIHPNHIAKRYKIKCIKTIKKYVERWERNETVLSEYELLKKHGKPTRKKIFDDEKLSNFVESTCTIDPTTILTRYRDHVFGNYGLHISEKTVERHFASKKWNWKRVSRIAFECDIEEEYLFWQFMSEIISDPDQLMFLDESNRNDCTSNKRRGRGPGRVYVPVHFVRGTYRFSLLLVSWRKGVVVYELYYGSVDLDKFIDFIMNKLLPFINPYPQKKSILLMDNITFHHCDFIIDIIDEIGAIAGFLPHYDPIYNLSEYCFRDVKAIETSKNIYGEKEAMLSMVESVERIRNKDYTQTLKQMGYI